MTTINLFGSADGDHSRPQAFKASVSGMAGIKTVFPTRRESLLKDRYATAKKGTVSTVGVWVQSGTVEGRLREAMGLKSKAPYVVGCVVDRYGREVKRG